MFQVWLAAASSTIAPLANFTPSPDTQLRRHDLSMHCMPFSLYIIWGKLFPLRTLVSVGAIYVYQRLGEISDNFGFLFCLGVGKGGGVWGRGGFGLIENEGGCCPRGSFSLFSSSIGLVSLRYQCERYHGDAPRKCKRGHRTSSLWGRGIAPNLFSLKHPNPTSRYMGGSSR